MHTRVFGYMNRVLALALVAAVPVALAAQAATTAKGTREAPSPSKFDIFMGYSFLAPKGTVQVPQPNGTTEPYSYDSVNLGGLFSGAYYFNRHLGLQVEFGEHEWGDATPPSNIGTHGNDDGFLTFAGGIIARFPKGNITPFVHALAGTARVGGPDFNPATWGPALTAGGGLDYETPLFHHHLAIRIFQADYEYMHANFGTGTYGGTASINAARLSAGLVFHIGPMAPPPAVTLSLAANPNSVYPGTPVTITATPGNLNPKLHSIYSYSGNGVTGSGTTATVDSSSLAPGTYTVSGTLKEGKPGKEGAKPWETAAATTSFTVKAYEPPTISCSASPTTIQPGGTSTITATAVSPQNLPLTYSYSASAGTVTGSGATAEYSSVGAPTGVVGITCKVSDDKGNTASADTNITIEAPPPPPTPHTQALCSISFTTDKRRPTRVDNEAKACLDQVALDLKQQPDATAVLVGESTSGEKAITDREEARAARYKRRHIRVVHYASQRAVNAKDYLVTEQGIDGSRIRVATSPMEGQEVQNYLVPSGANFSADVPGTTPVNENEVKPIPRTPLPMRHRARRAATSQ